MCKQRGSCRRGGGGGGMEVDRERKRKTVWMRKNVEGRETEERVKARRKQQHNQV